LAIAQDSLYLKFISCF